MTALLAGPAPARTAEVAAPAQPDRFPPRPVPAAWPATGLDAVRAQALLTGEPFFGARSERRHKQLTGARLLIDWLSGLPGDTWQQRWANSGAERAGRDWRALPADWARSQGAGLWHQEAVVEALPAAFSADLIRPSLHWLVGGGLARGRLLVPAFATGRDPDGFARLRQLCNIDPHVSAQAGTQTPYRAALILAAKGGVLSDVTVGDIVELLDVESAVKPGAVSRGPLFYRLMRELGFLGAHAPSSLRVLRTQAQLTPEELVDRYGIACRDVRDLLVDYLRERQPSLDYTSLAALATHLAKNFWADLEAHNRGLDSLDLPRPVADAWKRRLSTVTRTRPTASGDPVTQAVQRVNYRECLTPVRAFYLDIAHWAVEDPARWARWVAPCPVGAEEVNRSKHKRQRKARMDARTRERLPVLPALVRSVNHHRVRSAALLAAALDAPAATTFSAGGVTLRRATLDRGEPGRVWAADPSTGERRDLTREEDHAFWAWASVEVLRATGIRVEELAELSHHSLVQYRLPGTGEILPLLQIAPSKTDTERMLVVSPELADVLASVVARVRLPSGAIPLVAGYDGRERRWSSPAPLLFQRTVAGERRAITPSAVRTLLDQALTRSGLVNPADGTPLRCTPHDFRRMFITDAILNGLPPHIAQVIAGHQDINVTMGYKAVYPQETIQAHLAFLARRRALRPSEEYRVPTDEEWQGFLGHFERRTVSIGTCARAFGTPCAHEHACVRCSMLWPDPAQRPRLAQIRDNLQARIAEAEREGWLGEVDGLQVSLAGAEDKLAQLDSRRTNLPTPMFSPSSSAETAASAAG
jgi:integrase